MSDKTLYEIYKDICDCKDVEKEDLRLATLMYRDLLWFANHDVEEIYKNSNQDIFNKTRFRTNVTRYKKALNTVPRKWLGNENIPGTPKYEEKKRIFNNILDGFYKWNENKKEEKSNLYKAIYTQDPCNILTEESLNRLEEHCKKAIHYERGEIKREHEVILELLYKYKEQQEQKESQNKIIDLIEEDLQQLATAINEEYHVEEYLLNKETIKKYYERKVANEKE